jgi:hypothetical protein
LGHAVAVVLLRGLAGIVATEPRPASSRVVPPAPVWPDEAARAFAVEFAATYLTVDPEDAPASARLALAALAAPEVVDSLLPTLDGDAVRQEVVSATVAGAIGLDGTRALITITATVKGNRSRTVRLTVPVARDQHGGLVVYDLPALAPEPDRADAGPAAGTPIVGAERAAISDVLTRALRAYVSGDRASLAYLVPAGTRTGATVGGFELLDLGSLATLGATTDPRAAGAGDGPCPRSRVAGEVCVALPGPAGAPGSLVRGGDQRPHEGVRPDGSVHDH